MLINVELWQKDIAQVVGLSKGHVSEIVNKKSSETEHEPTINSTSAAEEIAALPKEKSLPMQEAPSPCGTVL
jgi:predicted XRE-type DNA-binding protein